MLIALRLGVPIDLRDSVLDVLDGDPRIASLAVVPGGSRVPEGDLVIADVAREAASSVIGTLTEAGLGARGSIVATDADITPFDRARAAVDAAPGEPDDGVIWAQVEQVARESSTPSWSFLTYLTLAVALAAIAVITDSPVLVVGAMVLGPEFNPLAAAFIGVVVRRWSFVWRGLALLLGGFAMAITVVASVSWAGHALDWFPRDKVTGAHPLTGFIWHPDRWSVTISLLAGIAGVLALTAGKSSTLVGVFISVTTVPAAGALALAVAVWEPTEMRGAIVQLLVNLAGMAVSGVSTLAVQRWAWSRVGGSIGRPHHF